jgi:hypothetical protein
MSVRKPKKRKKRNKVHELPAVELPHGDGGGTDWQGVLQLHADRQPIPAMVVDIIEHRRVITGATMRFTVGSTTYAAFAPVAELVDGRVECGKLTMVTLIMARDEQRLQVSQAEGLTRFLELHPPGTPLNGGTPCYLSKNYALVMVAGGFMALLRSNSYEGFHDLQQGQGIADLEVESIDIHHLRMHLRKRA